MIGVQEVVIIVVIAAIILGPGAFVKLGKRGKQTADSLKKGIESGARAAGADVDLENVSKDDLLNGVSKLQERVDSMLSEMGDAPKDSAADAGGEGTAGEDAPQETSSPEQ